ncbi:MAG: acetyl-CoA hydrolase/transferase family protein [Acidimicrobiales bacterium]|nr:acetyl-CoA hydrolase/transferase family protein [Acidimicrobiales bacterium]MCB9371658.1 acetyl-CoA hydrolase/transferase family protein [Microthrixaceae bacterium]
MAITLHTPEEGAELIRDVDRLGIPLGPGQPAGLLHALGKRERFDELVVFGALLVDLYELFTRPGVRLLSGFYGPAERFLIDSGADISFVPSDFRRFTPILERIAPRVMATAVSAPDEDGWMSLSVHAGATIAELNRAVADPDRVVIAEVVADAPRTFGIEPDHPHRLHVDDVDLVIEGDRPLFVLPDAVPTEVDEEIARHVRPFITDGCTLQTGIGGIPSTIARLLAEDSGGDYGVHSEMFTTGLMQLHKAGKVTNAHKGQFDGQSISTFAAGTSDLYEWLDGNDEVRFLPVDVVNSPEVIARNRKMVTINGALMLDLWGQTVADTLGSRQFSGIGGHEDFVSVSGLELEDRSLICLPSRANVDGRSVSRLLPALPQGTVVTTPRHQLDIVVTEHGAASLRGRTVRERAVALARIAHPDDRDELLAHARTMG